MTTQTEIDTVLDRLVANTGGFDGLMVFLDKYRKKSDQAERYLEQILLDGCQLDQEDQVTILSLLLTSADMPIAYKAIRAMGRKNNFPTQRRIPFKVDIDAVITKSKQGVSAK